MDVLVKVQPTPNPNALKFLVNRELKSDGKATFTDPDECEEVPLARALFDLPNVTQVYFFKNSITVTQNGASDWESLRQAVEDRIMWLADEHDPHFDVSEPTARPKRDRGELSEDLQIIEEILDRTVRPGLQADGGDLEVLELDGSILTVRYEGACGGCPSAMYGTLDAIRSILREEFRPDLEVVTV